MSGRAMSHGAGSNGWERSRSSLVFQCLLLVWGCCWTVAASGEELTFQLRLKGGGYASGSLLSSDQPGHVRLQCPDFQEPLEFAIRAVSSLEVDQSQPQPHTAEQVFYLSNGTSLAGRLTALDETNLVVQSPCLGVVHLPRAVLRHFVGNSGVGELVYAGPRGPNEWSEVANGTDWKYEAGSVVTSQKGTSIVGSVNLPQKSEVRVAFAWSGEPNFTLSLGCERPRKSIDRLDAAASLEIWDGRLVMVREADERADMALLPNLLTDRRQLELTIYLDQRSGVVAVCTPTGRLLGKLTVPDKLPKLKHLIALSNHDGSADRELRLERCEVREWNGRIPQELPDSDGAILLDDDQLFNGRLAALDSAGEELTVIGEDGKSSQIPVKKIQHVTVSTAPAAQPLSGESMAVTLADGSNLVGVWKQTESDKAMFTVDGVVEPVRFLLRDVVSAAGNAEGFQPPKLTGRRGELTTEGVKLPGCVVDSEGDGVLRWQALAATAPSPLAVTSSGTIQYESATAAVRHSQSVFRGGPLRLFGAPGVVIINGVPQPSPEASPARKKLELGLKLRRGDELPGFVERIDERGVTFRSSETEVTFLPNAEMDSVTLVTSRTADTQSPEKRKRLLTVPRSAKNDPPTHLLISTNGDFLRGRLVELNDARAVMEVRLEEVALPRNRIAEIHWLYRRDWEDHGADKSEQAAEAPVPLPNDQLLVHVVRQDGRPITFVPSAYSAGMLQGKSDLLGDCKVELAKVSTLRFGRKLIDSIGKETEDAWNLSLAISPKVYQEGESAAGEGSSPLVGKPAPPFSLGTVSGEKFELNQLRGRVLVLDFWASWCGPCLQTMPEVERIVNEVGGDQVDWVAVNLQETKERAQATIKRLGLSPIVVLDEDGEIAQLYQASAIPQTVIIDRQGKVTHLFVGGGPRVLSAFTEALTEVVNAP